MGDALNKAIRTAVVFAIVVLSSIGSFMQGQETREVTPQSNKQLQDCRRAINPDVFPPETCPVILSYLSPSDQLGQVGEDGKFLVLSRASDGTSTPKTYYLPPKLRSEIALNTLAQTIKDAQFADPKALRGLFAELATQGVNFWPKVRDVYCYYHPKETYMGFSGEKEECPVGLTLPNEKTLEGYFEGPLIFSINYHTFLNTLQAEEIDNRQSQK